jgi:hypothetical protein
MIWSTRTNSSCAQGFALLDLAGAEFSAETPFDSPFAIFANDRTASRNVFLGIVPVSRQTPPHGALFFDNGDPFAEFRRLYRVALARRFAADTNEIVIEFHRIRV